VTALATSAPATGAGAGVDDDVAPGSGSRWASTGRRLLGALAKLLELAAVMVLVTFGTFMLISLVPGDPTVTILGPDRPPEQYEALRAELGLDRPLLEGYANWLSNAVRGDLGESITGGEVASRVAAALPVSLQLAAMALVLSLIIAVPLAMVAAARPGGGIDRAVSALSFGLLSIPPFLSGLLLILVFVKAFPVLPRLEWVRLTSEEGLAGNLRHAILPVLAISFTVIPGFVRVLRSDLIETLQQDFVAAARARGRAPLRILVGDALRPSAFSLVTLIGISMGQLIGATVIVEVLFALPGIGSVAAKAAMGGDVPLVQGCVLVIAVIYVVANGLADAAYGWLDPRVRRKGART
jgi:peptide/nickel transport system permease protein